MPRKKKVPEPGTRRYGIKSNYTVPILEECLEKVRCGTLSAYAASKEFKIPINTIKNKIKNRHIEKVGRPTALPEEEENIIKDHVKTLADSGIPIGIDDVTLIIQKYLNSANRKVKVFKNNRPGWEWGKLFLERHQDLKVTLGNTISRNRAQVNEEKINEFFDNLESEIQDVPPENIFNFDETGFHDDPKKKKLLFRRKCRNTEVIRNSTKSCYTAVFCGSAAGEMLPPYFIFKAKNAWSDWLVGAPPGSRMTVTKSGWIDLDSFDDWFKYHFLPYAIKREGKKILICDNLSSHISVNTLKICHENNIKFVCLVPNSTHLLQPLDVGYFSSLKANWRSVLLNWRETTRGRKTVALPKNCFTVLVKRTLNLGAPQCKTNLETGFRVTGIHPLNRQMALQRLPEYAKTKVDVQTAKESLGESFKSYLAELRENDLGIRSQRKFQMPVIAGKSVSVEEVEQFYKNKAEAKNKNPKQPANSKSSVDPKKPVKRGRPQGSKNRKKIKSQEKEKENENFSKQKNNLEQTTKNTDHTNMKQKKGNESDGEERVIQRTPTESKTKDIELESNKNLDKGNEYDEIGNIINQPSTSKQRSKDIEMESNVDVSLEFEDMAMDLDIGNEVVIEEYLFMDETGELERTSECAEKAKPISLSNNSKFAQISPGTTVVFRDEGCLFPGKVVTSLPPYYVVAAMTKSIGGGWKWPDKKEMVKIKFDDIVSIVDSNKIKIKSLGVYHFEDDLLYMEWGE